MAKPLFLLLTLALTVWAYAASRQVFLRTKSALLNPVILSTAAIIALLALLGIPFEEYRPAKDIITSLLGPATVALALPLYRNRRYLMERWQAILLGIVTGSLFTLAAVILLARWGGLEEAILISLAPKSVTTPIAVEIARIIGGNPSLAAAFVVATGTFGSVVGPAFLSFLKIHDPVARGLAMGVTAHGQGTAVILHEGETQGAMAGAAMALAAVFTSAVAPWLVPWLAALGK